MNPENNYTLLIAKLDEFIKKYHQQKLIRGCIYFASFTLISFLLINSLEFYLFLSPIIKKIIWISYFIIVLYLVMKWLMQPALNLLRLRKTLDYAAAANILSAHFSEVKDQLINVLQLNEQASNTDQNTELILASIQQKTERLQPIPFVKAIDLKQNKKRLQYALIPFCILLLTAIFNPNFIKQGGTRLIHFDKSYAKPASFQFHLKNKSLVVKQGDAIKLELALTGDPIPQDIQVVINNNSYKLEKITKSTFAYTLLNLRQNSRFYFQALGYDSETYEITVLPNPAIVKFEIQVNYPNYLHKAAETVKNTGNLTIPAGSKLQWVFHTKAADDILFISNQQTEKINITENQAIYRKQIHKNLNYSIQAKNKNSFITEPINYVIEVIPDLYPSIRVSQVKDSSNRANLFFNGTVKDDYGLTKLEFHYSISKSNKESITKGVSIPIRLGATSEQFFYHINTSELGLALEDELQYYFEIWDNDGINGPKSSKSELFVYRAPSMANISKEENDANQALKDKIASAIKQAEKIQKDAKKINEKLRDKKELNFEEKKEVAELIANQKKLAEEVKEIQNQNLTNNEINKDYKKFDQELIDKKKQINELFENLLDNKTKELIKELEKLIAENNKEKTQESIQKMQLDNKEIAKEMDRMLELFKKLEVEQKTKENIERLNTLSEEQKAINEQLKNKKTPIEELKDAQQKLNKDFKDLQNDFKDLQQKNEALADKIEMENPAADLKDIENDLNKTNDELANNKTNKASESQKTAADKMKKLADKMKKQQEAGEAEELDLNMRALRQILDNLVQLSFAQEKTLNDTKKTNINDPQYTALAKTQRNLNEDMKMIEDSLFALSKKVLQIKSIVNKETGKASLNMLQSIAALEARNTGLASMRQQYAMTSINNLAVLLSEILDQMQKESQSKKQGGKPGAKPSKKPGGKGKGEGLSKMQSELNKQIEQLKNGMKPGQKPGKGQMSQQMAQMAAQQQAIRNAMDQLSQQMDKNGQGGNGKEISQLKKEMEKTESDLYNKNINQQTINRQQEIMSRLLETEKAIKEREQDQAREAAQGKTQQSPANIKFEQFKKTKTAEIDLMRTVPPNFKPYYKEKTNAYFDQLMIIQPK